MKRITMFLIALFSLTGAVYCQNDPPPPAPVTPKQISGGVLNGKATSLPKPIYPPAAVAVKASGAVSVQVLIDEGGNVISASAVSGHPLLRAAATEAARRATFSPTLLMGNPVKVSGVITYNFVPAAPPGEGVLGVIPSEDHDKIWVFGFMFTFVQEADSETIRLIGDEKEFLQILKDLSSDVPPELKNYKPMLEKLSSSDWAERANAAREFMTLLRPELDAEKTWQVDVGDKLALAVVELLKQKVRYVKTGDPYNAVALKAHLRGLSDLLASAPESSSAEFRANVQRFAAFGEKTDIATDKQFMAMIESLEPLFKAFEDVH